MSGAAGSDITVAFPGGTGLAGYERGQVFNLSGADPARQIGSCENPNGQTIVCSLFLGDRTQAAHRLRIVFDGIRNPAAGDHMVSVSTTSDTQTVQSSNFNVVPAKPLTAVTADNRAPSPG